MTSNSSVKAHENIIDELDINPRISICAKKAGYVTPSQLLHWSNVELQQRLGISAADVDQLLNALTEHVLCKPVTPWDMVHDRRHQLTHLTTGCPGLDKALGGGVPLCGVTEVAGEAGTGKTQFGLQLALYAQLPPSLGGLGKNVAYICTESQFPVGRLQQMIQHMVTSFPQGPKTYSNGILIHHSSDMDSLVDCVKYKLPLLVARHEVGLVIIDSIAAAFRAEEDTIINKALQLQCVGSRLHELAAAHNLAVVAINQVTATLGKTDLYDLGTNVKPALGLSWSNLVTTRVMLCRTRLALRAVQAKPSTSWTDGLPTKKRATEVEYRVRRLEIVFCPWLDRTCASYLVTEKGLEDVDEAGCDLHLVE